MKVLHLISGGDSGGAKTHVFNLLNKLTDKAEIYLVCLTAGVFYDEAVKLFPKETILFEQKSRFDMSSADKILELVREKNIDIIHCHGARANFVATYLKKRCSKPFVTTVHSDYLLDFDGIYRKIVYTTLNVMALRKMDYYIGVSSSFRNMLIQRKFRPNSVFEVYNGMDFDKETPFLSKEDFAKKFSIDVSENDIFVGIIGRHDYVKGHDIFVRAAKIASDKNPNLRFVVAGDGGDTDSLYKLTKELGMEDKIIYLGFLNDIYSFLNFVDINTLSSRCESFPYALLEGAKMKKPTISSCVGGIPDLICDGQTGLLFENENAEEFAQKILELAENTEKSKQLGENLYNLATNKFSNENLAQTHIEIYNAILRDFYDKKKYDVVFSGYYGFKNSGDDALLFEILDALRVYKPDIRALVLSKKPKETKAMYKVDAKNRFLPWSIIGGLKKSRMLINGGGSLIQDATSSKSLWYYLEIMKMAKKRGLSVFVYANGIGPIKKRNIKRTKAVLETVDFITLRDELSLEEIKKLGLENSKIEVTADPAIRVKITENTDKLLADEGVQKGKYIGVSVRDWQNKDKQFCQKLAKGLDSIYEKHNLLPVFIPMKYPDDVKFSEKIANLMLSPCHVLKKQYSVNEIVSITSKMEMILGMRLHILIYAMGSAVPTVGIVYDPKVSGFLNYIGQPRILSAKNLDISLLENYADEVISNKNEISENLKEKAKELSKKALLNAEYAVEILTKEKSHFE